MGTTITISKGCPHDAAVLPGISFGWDFIHVAGVWLRQQGALRALTRTESVESARPTAVGSSNSEVQCSGVAVGSPAHMGCVLPETTPWLRSWCSASLDNNELENNI